MNVRIINDQLHIDVKECLDKHGEEAVRQAHTLLFTAIGRHLKDKSLKDQQKFFEYMKEGEMTYENGNITFNNGQVFRISLG